LYTPLNAALLLSTRERGISRIPGRERSGDNYPALLLLETVAGLLLATILGEELTTNIIKAGGLKNTKYNNPTSGVYYYCVEFFRKAMTITALFTWSATRRLYVASFSPPARLGNAKMP
jgi:hypothetical protein